MAHVHSHCYHNFGFCAQCDLVYCKNCGKSWGNHVISTWSGPFWSTTAGVTSVPASDSISFTADAHTHS